MFFLQFLAQNYEPYLIYVKYTYALLLSFGLHKNLLNSNLVSILVSTAAEWIVLSFDTPYYTVLPPHILLKRRLETESHVLFTRGSSFQAQF